MDIVTRIKRFLSEYQIPNSQFADKCDIPRPTVSQLLNGRNKKVSDEVISKIHSAYPNLSIMWLMFGEEPMLLSPMENLNKQPQDDTTNQELFAEQHASDGTKGNSNNGRIVFNDDSECTEENSLEYNEKGKEESSSLSQTLEAIAKNVEKIERHADTTSANKRIVNVMVFYSDNSFESFVPYK